MGQTARQNTQFGSHPGGLFEEFHRIQHPSFIATGAIQDFFSDPVGEGIVDRNGEGIVGELDYQSRGHIRSHPDRQDQGQSVMHPQKRTGPGQDTGHKSTRHRTPVKRPQIGVDPMPPEPFAHLAVLQMLRA